LPLTAQIFVQTLKLAGGSLAAGIHVGHAPVQLSAIFWVLGPVQVGDKRGYVEALVNAHCGDGGFDFSQAHTRKLPPHAQSGKVGKKSGAFLVSKQRGGDLLYAEV
jgi:hypothetical protein